MRSFDWVVNNNIVKFNDRYYKYNVEEKCFYYADYSINNKWKKSVMTIEDFKNVKWELV